MNKFSIRILLFLSAILFSACNRNSGQRGSGNSRPNILLILADDLGYGDVSSFGNTEVATPNIDRLATQGIRFTDAHVTCPVCGPSRVGILGGIYQQKIGCYWNPDLWKSNGWHIPDSILLLPQALKNAGYITCHIGKWNVSEDPSLYVDEAYDVMMWKGAYYTDSTGSYPGVDRPNFKIEPHGWGPESPGDEYLTDRLTRHAIEFIEKHKNETFFLYLAFNAVHTPLQADEKYQIIFKDQKDEPNRIYAGMKTSLDDNIGKLMDKLGELDLDENTLVVFTSDNGPARGGKYIPGWPENWPETLLGSAGNLRGNKGQLYEGGHREPMIIRWPGVLNQNGIYEKTVSTLDLFPTLCEAAEIPKSEWPGLDGVSLLPYLTGENSMNPHDILFWMTDKQGAVRRGNYKLIVDFEDNLQLYDLSNDLSESNNISAQYPGVRAELLQSWNEWKKDFPISFTERELMKSDSLK